MYCLPGVDQMLCYIEEVRRGESNFLFPVLTVLVSVLLLLWILSVTQYVPSVLRGCPFCFPGLFLRGSSLISVCQVLSCACLQHNFAVVAVNQCPVLQSSPGFMDFAFLSLFKGKFSLVTLSGKLALLPREETINKHHEVKTMAVNPHADIVCFTLGKWASLSRGRLACGWIGWS